MRMFIQTKDQNQLEEVIRRTSLNGLYVGMGDRLGELIVNIPIKGRARFLKRHLEYLQNLGFQETKQ
jgi:hypothetical protein